MLRFRGDFLAIVPYHSSTERQCSVFGVGFGTFERICSVFQGHFQVIFMTEWVDSDVLNWVGMLRFRQVVHAQVEHFQAEPACLIAYGIGKVCLPAARLGYYQQVLSASDEAAVGDGQQCFPVEIPGWAALDILNERLTGKLGALHQPGRSLVITMPYLRLNEFRKHSLQAWTHLHGQGQQVACCLRHAVLLQFLKLEHNEVTVHHPPPFLPEGWTCRLPRLSRRRYAVYVR